MYGTVHHPVQWYLNEVQFPKELRPASPTVAVSCMPHLNEVQFPKELRR